MTYQGRQTLLEIVIDLHELVRFKKGVNKKREKIFQVAGQRYVKYLRNRFISLSAKGGEWEPLSEKTVRRKEFRQKKYGTPAQPHWILRETNQLVNNIQFESNRNGFKVGYWNTEVHLRPGDSREDRPTVSQLAFIHQYGGDNTPARPIIVRPNRATMRSMVEAIEAEFGQIIKESK